MKFTVKQSVFKQGLSLVSHAVPTRALRPIEKYILATRDHNRIRLSARNEEMGIHYWIDAESIEGDGAILLPAKLITDFVANVPTAPVSVTSPSPAQADACHVRCLRMTADMKNATDDPAEFPAIPSFAQGGEMLMQLDADFLQEIIAQTAFAAADKDKSGWPWSIGIKVEISDGKAVFLATDSFRLAMHTVTIPDDQLRCTLLIPAKTMEALAKMLPSSGTVQMMLTPNRNMLLFHVEAADRTTAIDLSARLLNETYPALQNAIPTAWTTRTVMRTQELAATVRLMAPYAQENTGKIHFTFFGEHHEQRNLTDEANTVTLQTIAQDIGSVENVVSANVQGPPQDIYLNAKHLSDVLATLDTTEVVLEVTARDRPALMRPVGPSAYVYLLVPMHTSQQSSEQATISSNGSVPVATHQ